MGFASTFQMIASRTREAAAALRGKPPGGHRFVYDPNLDSARSRLLKRLTPGRLLTILRDGDDGQITDALNLFEEMERTDARLYAVAQTRRLALTGLDWEVVSASDVRQVKDKALADEAASFVRESLDDLPDFEPALEHLAGAIGPNVAVVELIWEDSRITAMEPIPVWRLTMDTTKSADVRIISGDDRLGAVPEPLKFIVHVPNSKCGSPIAGSLTRATALLYIVKLLALSDWGTFAELFGMPTRWATFPASASAAERRALLAMLKSMGTTAYGAFSTGVQLQFLESTQRGTAPYEALINYVDRERAIAWLGGNLTSDNTGATGSLATAVVQDKVRTDIRDDDIRREARTVRQQVLAPMVAFGFPGRDAAVPVFRRVKPETIDRIRESQVILNAQRTGMEVPEAWARKTLSIPKPAVGDDGRKEAVLEDEDVFGDGVIEGQRIDPTDPFAV